MPWWGVFTTSALRNSAPKVSRKYFWVSPVISAVNGPAVGVGVIYGLYQLAQGALGALAFGLPRGEAAP